VARFNESAQALLGAPDFWFGLMKSAVFACVICTIACDRGLATSDGAEGVGRSTTQTVVLCVVFVLITNLILNALINQVLLPQVSGP
jgi:phospholipid/cholesterol/gamma-HCH transport system permease protein